MDTEEFLCGKIILINKPLHWTSFQAVSKLKYLLKKKLDVKKIKIGHAGTLDPLATGLLIICTGKFTKKITEIQIQQKEYQGVITLGATTPSYDLETEIDAIFDTSFITDEMIFNCAKSFEGEIMQKPPMYSAIKKDGVRLYELARKQETIEIQARPTTIYKFKVTKIEMPSVFFTINCSKGTYIRSIAYDFGKALNTGAHLTKLVRTKIGDYTLENAITPQEFEIKITS